MLGLQGIGSADFRAYGAARHASDEIRDCPAVALRMEQIHHYHRVGMVDGCQVARGASGNAKSHRKSLQDGGGSSHMLRGEAAVLSGHLVSAHTGDQKYDKKLVLFCTYI